MHRDLKPENIMIEKVSEDPVPNSGDALIMDFGIARSVEHGATQTAAGSVIGTLEYMAPEQAQGKKVDQRADQYALGLIMYDMLVGRQRLANRENPMAELLARMSAAPPAPRTINAAIPESVNSIVVRLLDPNPENRLPIDAGAGRGARSAGAGRIDPLRHSRGDRPRRAGAIEAGDGGALSSCSPAPRPAGCCRAAT